MGNSGGDWHMQMHNAYTNFHFVFILSFPSHFFRVVFRVWFGSAILTRFRQLNLRGVTGKLENCVTHKTRPGPPTGMMEGVAFWVAAHECCMLHTRTRTHVRDDRHS